MKIVFAVFVGWAMFLIGFSFGHASSSLHHRLYETGLAEEVKGERRACPGLPVNPRTTLMEQLIKDATGRSNVCNLFTYGCWCGKRGHGKYVDNFDYCCKVHDFCEEALLQDSDKCHVNGGSVFMTKDFKYNKATNKCSPLSEFREGSDEERQCRHALCLCELEMVRCMGHNKNEIDTAKISYKQCNITDSPVCNTKADVIVLIQDSQGISPATFQNIKTVVKRMLRRLSSESTDFNFALAKYATSRRVSCFGSADETISYIDNEYQHGGSGRNLLELALSKMVLKQFDKRRDDRKTDTAKILVILSDGNSVDKSGEIMDTFMLEKTAKLLRVNNNIKIAGALIPNTEKVPRIQELKGIVTEPDDAIVADFSSYFNKIADLLVMKVKESLCYYGEYFCSEKADVIILIQDSQGITSATVENTKTVVKRLVTKLSAELTDTDFKFAVAKYATSRRISCFGTTAETISYIDNEYQYAGSGLNLLNLALSKMVLKQFDKRPDDRKTDTSQIVVIFSDGNAQNENGDIMDTSTLEQTAKSLKDKYIDMLGVLIPNTEKASRTQELKSVVSDIIDAGFNSIADLLAFRVKRLVGCLVQYTVKVYTRDSHARGDYRLTVRIEGQGEQKTADHILYETTQDTQRNLHVIVSEFYDLDVGTVKKIDIKPKRLPFAPSYRAGWNLKEVKITKGGETLTAAFDQAIPKWNQNNRWYSARAWLRPYLTYSVEIYTPDTNVKNMLKARVQIIGDEFMETKRLTLFDLANRPQTTVQKNQLVIKASFRDINVGSLMAVWIEPQPAVDWTLKKIKVSNGEETVTANFDKLFRAWTINSHSESFSRNGA